MADRDKKRRSRTNKADAQTKDAMATTRQTTAAPLSLSDLITELDKQRTAISAEIKTSLTPIQKTLNAVRAKVDEFGPRLAIMETTLTDHSDRLSGLETQVKTLQSENDYLKKKADSQESSNYRYSVRVIGLDENCEGRSPTDFMSTLLAEILQDDSLAISAPLEVEAAYRMPKAKPAAGERPRPIIVRFLRYKQREQVLDLAKKRGQLSYQGKNIFIFPNRYLSKEDAKKRASFSAIKSKLFDKGIKFTLRHPAILSITLEGVENKFHNAEEAEKFFTEQVLEKDE